MGNHTQGMQLGAFGGAQALFKILLVIFVHQESDRTEIHSVNRLAQIAEGVKRLQHEAVAAERDDDIGLVAARVGIALSKRLQCVLCLSYIGCNEMK
jgi:hypothetical protein